MNRLHNTLRKLHQRMSHATPAGTAVLADVSSMHDYREAFEEAMNDDFNTPRALAVLFDFVKEVNRYLDEQEEVSEGTLATMDKVFQDTAGDVLALLPEDLPAPQGGQELLDDLMQILLDMRSEYRASKDRSRADAIRSRLAEIGITVYDNPEGSTWSVE
jgi:cysteinyl-tRNA synthetase